MPRKRPLGKGRALPEERRKRAYRLGLRAEWIAQSLLRLKGYHILDRQFVAQGGEIDLIAASQDTIIFVEVKARPYHAQAQEAITALKVKRISKAARYWMSQNSWCANYNLRGDAITLNGWLWPQHQIGAFELML